MAEQRNKVCGVDIHKKFLIATILSRDRTKMQKRFGTDVDDLLNFRDWVIKGRSIEMILDGIPSKRVRKNADQIRTAIRTGLDQTQIFLIKSHLDTIDCLTHKLDEIDLEIKRRVSGRKDDLKIATSVPGIGFTAATTILAEIGNYRDFSAPDKLAAWCGIVPSVYQSADKLLTGSITKQGSKHIRWILVQVAQAASKKKGSKQRKFFLRVKARKGHNFTFLQVITLFVNSILQTNRNGKPSQSLFSLICELSDKQCKRLHISGNLQRAFIHWIENHIANQPGSQIFGALIVAAVHQARSIGLTFGFINAEKHFIRHSVGCEHYPSRWNILC